jgi:hypothetical protein
VQAGPLNMFVHVADWLRTYPANSTGSVRITTAGDPTNTTEYISIDTQFPSASPSIPTCRARTMHYRPWVDGSSPAATQHCHSEEQ